MDEPIDIIIPTNRSLGEVAQQMADVVLTSGLQDVRVIATCTDASASRNRNIGLDKSTSRVRIMMDDDISGFPYGWAHDLVVVFDQHPDCVMLSAQLTNQDGSPAFMMGMNDVYGNNAVPEGGRTILPSQKLLTACFVTDSDLRFDENFRGSGFEDDKFCDELRANHPDGQWIVCHDVRVVHLNEQKNQRGENWDFNKAYYESTKVKL